MKHKIKIIITTSILCILQIIVLYKLINNYFTKDIISYNNYPFYEYILTKLLNIT